MNEIIATISDPSSIRLFDSIKDAMDENDNTICAESQTEKDHEREARDYVDKARKLGREGFVKRRGAVYREFERGYKPND